MAILARDMGFEVIFTHVDEESGVTTHIAVERLTCHLNAVKHPISYVPIERGFAEFCLVQRGIEMHRLARLGPEQLREPLLFCEWPGGYNLLVDGHHRYVRKALARQVDARAWVVPEAVWRPFVIEGLPSVTATELAKMSSGIR